MPPSLLSAVFPQLLHGAVKSYEVSAASFSRDELQLADAAGRMLLTGSIARSGYLSYS